MDIPRDPAVAERRILPALPDSDPEMGEIRWERWEPALIMTHIDPTCVTCAFPGPCPLPSARPSTRPRPHWYASNAPSGDGLRSGRRSSTAPIGASPTGPCGAHAATRCASTGKGTGQRSTTGRPPPSEPFRPPRTTSCSDSPSTRASPDRRCRTAGIPFSPLMCCLPWLTCAAAGRPRHGVLRAQGGGHLECRRIPADAYGSTTASTVAAVPTASQGPAMRRSTHHSRSADPGSQGVRNSPV